MEAGSSLQIDVTASRSSHGEIQQRPLRRAPHLPLNHFSHPRSFLPLQPRFSHVICGSWFCRKCATTCEHVAPVNTDTGRLCCPFAAGAWYKSMGFTRWEPSPKAGDVCRGCQRRAGCAGCASRALGCLLVIPAGPAARGTSIKVSHKK